MKRFLLIAVAVGTITVVATPTHATPAANGTVVTHVRPVDASGQLAAGYRIAHRLSGANCQSGSPTVTGAYRCFSSQARDGVFNSCWVTADHDFVDCISKPWQHKVSRLHVTGRYDDHKGFGKVRRPWGLDIGKRFRCLVILGPSDTTRGRVVNFGCNHKTVLAGRVHHGRTWRVRAYRKVHHGKNHLTYRSLGMKPIATAWFGKRSQPDSG